MDTHARRGRHDERSSAIQVRRLAAEEDTSSQPLLCMTRDVASCCTRRPSCSTKENRLLRLRRVARWVCNLVPDREVSMRRPTARTEFRCLARTRDRRQPRSRSYTIRPNFQGRRSLSLQAERRRMFLRATRWCLAADCMNLRWDRTCIQGNQAEVLGGQSIHVRRTHQLHLDNCTRTWARVCPRKRSVAQRNRLARCRHTHAGTARGRTTVLGRTRILCARICTGIRPTVMVCLRRSPQRVCLRVLDDPPPLGPCRLSRNFPSKTKTHERRKKRRQSTSSCTM